MDIIRINRKTGKNIEKLYNENDDKDGTLFLNT